jgi:hypothetical protein
MWLVLAGHLISIALSFFLISDFGEALGVALCLLPLTATILMFIVQFHDENFLGSSTDEAVVSTDAAWLTLVLSAVLLMAIVFALVGYYWGRIGSIGTLQKAVSLIDTAVAVYLTILLRRLFERRV